MNAIMSDDTHTMQQKIPYGESNFRKVITQGYTYIDKTAYIATLEEAGSYHILLRPRRFGKSLFLSMLEHYYDVAYAAEFDALFAKLHIGKYPTPRKNSYQVLFMEFSGIATGQGMDTLYRDFDREVANALKRFLQRYAYPPETLAIIEAEFVPHSKMKAFLRLVEGEKILLLIDEYDHFANSLLSQDIKLFQNSVGRQRFRAS